MQAVLAVLLATLAGFGGAMCGTSILLEFSKLRDRWDFRLNQHSTSQEVTQPPATSNTQQSTPPPETGESRV